MTGLFVEAQNPWVKDQDEVYLRMNTDKIGIGVYPGAPKVTIGSVAGETPLALKGYSSPYNPYITLYSSDDVAIWKLFANSSWWTIGSTRDTTTALIVVKNSKNWIRINGTLYATKLKSNSGEFTDVTASTLTTTTIVSNIAQLATASTVTHTTVHFEATDSTGLYLYSSDGTRYRIFITTSGTVSTTTAP